MPELRPPARRGGGRLLGLHRARADRPPGGAPAAGLIAGRYLPQRLLGRGGAKDVWLAHDLTLDRPVALSRARDGRGAPPRASGCGTRRG